MRNFRIGRNADNDIVYSDPSISGSHADLTIEDNGQIILTDHSTNGTFVNGQPVRHSSVNLNFGDSVVFPGGMQLDWNHISSMLQSFMPQSQPQPQIEQPNLSSNQYGGYASGDCIGGDYVSAAGIEDFYPTGNLSFNLSFSEGFSSGLRNSLSLLAAMLLFVLTCWIPYINLGAFIALVSLPAHWARNESFSPLSIFDSKYRRLIGDYVILMSVRASALLICLIFFYVPAIVMGVAWSLSDLFCIHKGKSFLDSLRASNQATYGHKWMISGIYFVFTISYMVVLGIIQLLFALIMAEADFSLALVVIDVIIVVVLSALASSILLGIQGSIWRQLTGYND